MPPGTTEEERQQALQMVQMQKFMGYGVESCIFKTTLAGGAGYALLLPPLAVLSCPALPFLSLLPSAVASLLIS
jgi:hypothetical protein